MYFKWIQFDKKNYLHNISETNSLLEGESSLQYLVQFFPLKEG